MYIKDMMGLLVVIYIVFCEVKWLKFIMPICGSDCPREGLPVIML